MVVRCVERFARTSRVRLRGSGLAGLFSALAQVCSGPDDAQRKTRDHADERKEIEEECRWDDLDQHQERQRDPEDGKQKTDQDKGPGRHGR